VIWVVKIKLPINFYIIKGGIEMNLGEFVICKDFQQIGWYFQNHPNDKTRIIVLDDEVVHAEGYIQGSLLLPPPSACTTSSSNTMIRVLSLG
jgi:hypothetical protein